VSLGILGGGAVGLGRARPGPFPPKLSVSDDFERASLGANWTVRYPTGGDAAQVTIVGSSDLGMLNGAQAFQIVERTAEILKPDQWVEGVISTEGDVVNWARQIFVRRNNATLARYAFHYDNDPGQPEFGLWCLKYDGVAAQNTRVFATSVPLQTPVAGDRLTLEIIDYTLRGYLNGVLVIQGTDTDSSKIAAGAPGLVARLAVGNGTNPATEKLWESFAAGDM